MLSKGPHISIESETLVPRILRIAQQEFSEWPESVRQMAISIAEELFLVRYNPFVAAETVRRSVNERFENSRKSLAHYYATSIAEGITMFWSAHESDMAFRKELIAKLLTVLPSENIDASSHALVENATDATDLRLELPILVVTPNSPEQVSAIVRLANDMHFALVPRGGGSGLTGGAIPARKRSVVLSLSKLTKISPIDTENLTITVEAGVITNDAILAAAKEDLLFSVDPASKTASTIGGNIAENAGGPLCFEYGTTIDNLLSYRMVTPTGELIEVIRQNHPRHKIHPEETAVFEVRDLSGGLRSIVKLKGPEIRTPGLGKDVTNKTLGGLPGLQKEGTDGVILDATFILHKKHKHFRVMVLEFFGRSLESCMHVVNDIVALRNDSRSRGDLVKVTALEEFGTKYIQAIEYQKKSVAYEGIPVSVLILQLDSDDQYALDETVVAIRQICKLYENVDSFTAQDAKEAEVFWEDRHKLSAIAKRTSGFKINEDVVIPLQAIPQFALYLEALNLEYMARAYRSALRRILDLPGFPEEEGIVTEEIAYTRRITQGEITSNEISDQELQEHAETTLQGLIETYPAFAKKIAALEERMLSTAICVASHMHAGDGNWHVNIPVNSNDPDMLRNAEKVAGLVMAKAQEVGGEVTGEHGIGITKIAYLTDEKITSFREFKNLVDQRNIFNPAKLTQRELPVAPFTFSFNRLIQDIRQSGLADKERLISLLANIQICTRCGKCKQFCPMHYPEESLLYHPRNKNISLGALIEAIYYSQVNDGRPDPFLLMELQNLVEHCTGCGKCMAVCPVKIASADVALALRGVLEEEGAGGHPFKSRILKHIAANPSKRIPKVAKAAALGQSVQNKILKALPGSFRKRFTSPLFSAPGPRPAYRNLMEILHLERGSFFVPQGEVKGTVLYFTGCGGSVFLRSIGLGGIMLLLKAGYAVLLPEKHLCCGYPLLAAGAHEEFAENQDKNITHLRAIAQKAMDAGLPVTHVLTSCGSCRDGMERHFIPEVFPLVGKDAVVLADVAHFLFDALPPFPGKSDYSETQTPGKVKNPLPFMNGNNREAPSHTHILYHSPCHAEVPGVNKAKAGPLYAASLAKYLGITVDLSPGCCGESGMGAMTSPAIYNKIRQRKSAQLSSDLQKIPEDAPIIVGCPSCKFGLQRILMQQDNSRTVLHTLEFMAEKVFKERWTRRSKKLLARTVADGNGIRKVAVDDISSIIDEPEDGHDDL